VVQLITITDGEPTNEPEHKVFQVIKRAKDFMSQTPYGPKAIAFEFAQARISPSGNKMSSLLLITPSPGQLDAARVSRCHHHCVSCVLTKT